LNGKCERKTKKKKMMRTRRKMKETQDWEKILPNLERPWFDGS